MTSGEKTLAWIGGIGAAVFVGWLIFRPESTVSCPNRVLMMYRCQLISTYHVSVGNPQPALTAHMESWAQQIAQRQAVVNGQPLSSYNPPPSGCTLSVVTFDSGAVVPHPVQIPYVAIVSGDPRNAILGGRIGVAVTNLVTVAKYTMS